MLGDSNSEFPPRRRSIGLPHQGHPCRLPIGGALRCLASDERLFSVPSHVLSGRVRILGVSCARAKWNRETWIGKVAFSRLYKSTSNSQRRLLPGRVEGLAAEPLFKEGRVVGNRVFVFWRRICSAAPTTNYFHPLPIIGEGFGQQPTPPRYSSASLS